MTRGFEPAPGDEQVVMGSGVLANADERTLAILEHRARTHWRHRGWLIRRLLLGADVLGLVVAYLLAQAMTAGQTDATGELARETRDAALRSRRCPCWIVLAKLYGLYERDEERTDHSTVDDLFGVFHLLTVGAWVLLVGELGDEAPSEPHLCKLVAFWAARDRPHRHVGRSIARADLPTQRRLPPEHAHRRRRRRRPARWRGSSSSTRSTGSTSSASSTTTPRERAAATWRI